MPLGGQEATLFSLVKRRRLGLSALLVPYTWLTSNVMTNDVDLLFDACMFDDKGVQVRGYNALGISCSSHAARGGL